MSDYSSKKLNKRTKFTSPLNFTFSKTDHQKNEEGAALSSNAVSKIQFDLKPEELEAYLNEHMIKQDEAKAILATKVCTHFNRIKQELKSDESKNLKAVGRIKNNIVMIGPTGVGKTYMVKLMANKLGVPFVKGDATKFSETGYVGGDVEDLVRDLVHQANDDIQLAQYGIVYVDEIDKIASSGKHIGPDVSRTGVQRALLKPMEETEVDLKVPHDLVSQIQAIEQYRKTGKREKRVVNTRNILFIVSGVFNDITEIIKKRVIKQGIGFGADLRTKGEKDYYLKMVKAEDLILYGFESEFVGRLPVVAVFEELSVNDLYEILKNPKNPVINAKRADFRAYGIDIRFEDKALRMLAELAHEERTGARGLVSVLEKVVLPFEKKLPSTDIRFFVVTPEVVKGPQSTLEAVLKNPEDHSLVDRYERVFAADKAAVIQAIFERETYYGEKYTAAFTEARINLIVTWHLHSGIEVEDLFGQMLAMIGEVRGFEYTFLHEHKIRVRFTEDAVDEIIKQAVREESSAATVYRRVFKDYDYALSLVTERTGQQEFVIPKRAILDPEGFFSETIMNSYGGGASGISSANRA